MIRGTPPNMKAVRGGLPFCRTGLKTGDAMIKAGDMLQNIRSGEVFKVRSADTSIIILATRDESHSMFVNPQKIESVFLPFVGDEGKKKNR
jgi:hypothetical protein